MYVINSKDYVTAEKIFLATYNTLFFQLFTLKYLCKLIDLTKSYVRKQKGVFFSEHTVRGCNPFRRLCMNRGNWQTEGNRAYTY